MLAPGWERCFRTGSGMKAGSLLIWDGWGARTGGARRGVFRDCERVKVVQV